MENQEEFLEFAISKFLKFGSKRFTLDDLAHEMGISKKTIYRYFSSKEEIVQESLKYLLTGVQTEITEGWIILKSSVRHFYWVYKNTIHGPMNYSMNLGQRKYMIAFLICYNRLKLRGK